MPRILRIFNRLIIGGPAYNVTFLTKFLSPDFETKLLIGAAENDEKEATCLLQKYDLHPIEITSMKRAINIADDRKAYREIKKVIQDFKPHIVHTHAAKPGALGRLAAAACKVPVIVHTFHGHVFHSYFGQTKSWFFVQAERYLAKKTDRIIAISDKQQDELLNRFAICPQSKMSIIPLGLDLAKFGCDQHVKRTAFRTKYQIQDDEIAIGIIGRIVPVKNHALFIDAVSELLRRTHKKIKVIIVGDGDLRQALEVQLDHYGISHNYFPENEQAQTVTFTSWLTEMDEVYAGIDIVALSSLNEGTPVSLIEAQAAGKPIVSTNVGGVKDVVLENVTALVTDTENRQQFAEALLQLTENDELRMQFGVQGAGHVMARFDKSRLVSDMRNLYYRLLDEKNIKY